MATHLIRHGEVDNPRNVVYADIPGYGLSDTGRKQAAATGNYLSRAPIARIVSSPLDRAIETAGLIATATGAETTVDDRLTEWGLVVRWRGAVWPELPVVFPGELEAYLTDPHQLPFAPESLEQVAGRVAAAIRDWEHDSDGDVALVSHQDPIHAARLHLVGESGQEFHQRKPGHGTVISLRRSPTGWVEANRWDPEQ